tara:strand:- start:5504 stop:6667 length:1164 start_codon:yes stop_codon:yes gene_type:complete
MANFYKPLNQQNDIVNTKTLLHEAIPLTGTIVSGTYDDANIKEYTHGMFTSVYDYPYLSSSANHIFDITVGISPKSGLSSSLAAHQAKKINVYNQMAQVLMGYDQTGSVLQFDEDGDIIGGGTKLKEVFFVNFSRLLVKDEIKKGTFELEFGVNTTSSTQFADKKELHIERLKITDLSGSDSYNVNSPVGEYGILYVTGSSEYSYSGSLKATEKSSILKDFAGNGESTPCGLLFYQAGVAVITGSIFLKESSGGLLNNLHGDVEMKGPVGGRNEDVVSVLTGSLISGSSDNLRERLYNLQFNNTTELNSTVYFCRVNHNEFNYSSNPTYLSGSKIRVKTQSTDVPISYITSIGLYSDSNELLAVAKLSEPLKKSPDTEFTLRVRLDY